MFLQRNFLRIFVFTLSLLSTCVTVYTKSACIIIHGTWAQSYAWHKPGGDFFDAIALSNQYYRIVDEVISFQWSGQLGRQAHVLAAQSLVNIIEEYEDIILVAHSHGATVGIIASILLGQNRTSGNYFKKIKKFYALGVPVDPTSVLYPDMYVVDAFYNMFSFGDVVQPVQGLYNRVFEHHERVSNISILMFDMHPGHSDLHAHHIGKHLLCIPEIYKFQRIEGFDCFQHGQAAEIHFDYQSYPIYRLQYDQEKLLRIDKAATELQQKAFFRSKKQ